MQHDEVMAERFRRFVAEATTSPLYQALCPMLADSQAALAMYADTPPTQRRPNLLLAAIHASVLRDPDHPLAAWFATVGGTRSPADLTLRDAVEAFVHDRADELRFGVTHGATQTNEVGRTATLLAALGDVAARLGGGAVPFGLVEIGPSAGLNLRLDRYRYEYATPDGAVHVGDPTSPVLVTCDATRSDVPLPAGPMESVRIGTRIGVDLHPVDLADPDRARWLEALVWPDELGRFRRLSAAVELAGSIPVDLRQGDAVDDLAAALGDVPPGQHPVVVTTWVLTYLPEERRRGFAAELDRLGSTRDLTWICVEHPAYAASLPFPPGAGELALDAGNPVGVHEWRSGRVERRWVATTHPHGTWMRWHPGRTAA